jgi:hypothetical protein
MPTSKSKGKKTATTDKALEKAVKDGLAALAALTAKLEKHGLASKTPDERQHSNGKLRDGEDAAMSNVLDTVDAHAGLFQALAPHDHGDDDKAVETGPARVALSRRGVVAPLAAAAQVLADRLGDELLTGGETAKDVTGPAYAIIKANAEVMPALKKKAAPALTYYANFGKRKPAKKAPAPKG